MFENRSDAGRRLAARLLRYRDRDPVVLALPRGGVPVAYEVARALRAPLDVLVVRKIGAPEDEEVGVGAVAEGGAVYLSGALFDVPGATAAWLETATRRQAAEVTRRVRAYRGGRAPLDVAGRTVIVVDDGLATGVTARAALRALGQRSPGATVLAVPVGAADAVTAIGAECNEVVCLESPARFRAVALAYADFEQTSDEEVVALLARAAAEHATGRAAPKAGT